MTDYGDRATLVDGDGLYSGVFRCEGMLPCPKCGCVPDIRMSVSSGICMSASYYVLHPGADCVAQSDNIDSCVEKWNEAVNDMQGWFEESHKFWSEVSEIDNGGR